MMRESDKIQTKSRNFESYLLVLDTELLKDYSIRIKHDLPNQRKQNESNRFFFSSLLHFRHTEHVVGFADSHTCTYTVHTHTHA